MYTEFYSYLKRFEKDDTTCYQDCVKELATLCAYSEKGIPFLWYEMLNSILNCIEIKVEYNLKQAVSNWLYAAGLWNQDLYTHLAKEGYCLTQEIDDCYDFAYSREYGQFNYLSDRRLKIYIQTIAMFETFKYYLLTEVAKDNYHWATYSRHERTFGAYEVWDMISTKYPVEIDWKFYDIVVNGQDFSYDTSSQTRLLDEYLGQKQYRKILPSGQRYLLPSHKFILGSRKDEQGNTYSSDGRYLIEFSNNELTEYRVKDGTCLMNNFQSDNRLKRLTIPSSVVVIGDSIGGNELVTLVIEGNGLEIIAAYAFNDCTGLSEINLPDSVTCIDEFAFADCCMPVFHVGKNILSLTGGSDINPVDKPLYSFGNEDTYCIAVHEDNPNYCSIDGMLYSKDRKKLYFCPGGGLEKEKTGTLHIPEGTEILYTSCMENVSGLKKVVLPSTVRSLGDSFVSPNEKIQMVCYAETPPTMEGNLNYDKLTLRVPEEFLDKYEPLQHRFPKLSRKLVLALLCVVCLGFGLHMEPIFKWGPWMDIVSIYIIPIGATLGAVSWFWVMKKEHLLEEINKGTGKPHGALWHSMGRYAYVLCAMILCCVALFMKVAF